ncbi:MAG: PKD domain-containing protein, partial [Planctomycetota bacterium]
MKSGTPAVWMGIVSTSLACFASPPASAANRVSLPQLVVPEGATGQAVEVRCEHDFALAAYALVVAYDEVYLEVAGATVEGTSAGGAEFADVADVGGVLVFNVVLDTALPFTRSLPPAADHTLGRLTVSLRPAAAPGTLTSLVFLSDFDDGHHVYDTLLANEAGESVIPVRANGSIEVVAAGEPVSPIANAGPDILVAEGSQVSLDGSGSASPAGESLAYLWEQTSGPGVDLSGADLAQAAIAFTAPEVADDAVAVFRLTVTGEESDLASSDGVRISIADLDSRTATCSVSESAQGLIDGGRRAVLFEGAVAWNSPREGLTWHRVRFRGVGRGDESRLLRAARLYLDADGGGAFDDADEPLGDLVPEIPPDDAIEFVFFRAIPDGAAETYFLVAEVTSPRPASGAAVIPGIAVLAAAFGVGLRGRRRSGRARGISLALAAA